MSDVLIDIRGVSFRYGQDHEPALDNVDLQVNKGEFVVITGPSGCGKSTLCRCLNGLIPRSTEGDFSGEVTSCGMKARDHEVHELASMIAMVFQNPDNQLFTNTVESEIAFGPENLGLSVDEIDARIDSALSTAGIRHLRSRLIDELSGGEKQRVALAAAMAMKPEVLVLDEPTSELDPKGAFDLIEALKRLNDRAGMTIVLVEHRIERLLDAAHRLIVMDKGRIVYDGTPESVFDNDLESMGVCEPPLACFTKRFGLPFCSTAECLSAGGGWYAAYGERQNKRGEAIISFQNVHYRYPSGNPALKGITLDLYRGELTVIMGANGSGKTTLIKHMNGLLKPCNGGVLIEGRDIAKMRVAENAKKVGLVFQNASHQLFEETIFEELAFAPGNLGLPEAEVTLRVNETTASLDLNKLDMSRPPLLLSGGEMQRAAIASVLTMQPDVLVLDEPTLGLDHGLKKKLAMLLKRLIAGNRAVIVVTHDVEFAAAYADRAILIADGRIIADGLARDVLTSDAETASLHLSQSTAIGDRLGLKGILSVDEIRRGVP